MKRPDQMLELLSYGLRHACATVLLAQGQELKVVQEILGHSSISTTGNVYAHVLMGLKRRPPPAWTQCLT